MGIAAQNILGGIALIWLCRLISQDPKRAEKWLVFKRHYLWNVAFAGIFVLWTIVATTLNPQNPNQNYGHEFLGYLSWMTLPMACWFVYGDSLTKNTWMRLRNLAAIIIFLWGLIAISQYLWDWKIDGSILVRGGRRPQGIYSHPLTLAYAILAICPLSLYECFTSPRRITSWLMVFGATAIVLLTQSRTVQATYALLFLFFCFWSLKGRWRILTLSALMVAALAAVVIPNPFTWKFMKTFSAEGVDRHSAFLDDRIAFWQIHIDMIKERPWLGHGFDLNTAYRTPFYVNAGLGNFAKKYEAHNMYLQVLANGGLIGFALFLGWIIREVGMSLQKRTRYPARIIIPLTWLAYLLASLTQNSFQDGEVRLAMTLLVCVAWLARDTKELPTNLGSKGSQGT